MVVLALKRRRMVPGPESNSSRAPPTSSMTEHELRSREGTQVPDPRIVTVISGFASDMPVIYPNMNSDSGIKHLPHSGGQEVKLNKKL